MRLLTIFKSVDGVSDLKERVRQSSTILTKNYRGRPIDIKVHVLYHSDGLALLYVNNTN